MKMLAMGIWSVALYIVLTGCEAPVASGTSDYGDGEDTPEFTLWFGNHSGEPIKIRARVLGQEDDKGWLGADLEPGRYSSVFSFRDDGAYGYEVYCEIEGFYPQRMDLPLGQAPMWHGFLVDSDRRLAVREASELWGFLYWGGMDYANEYRVMDKEHLTEPLPFVNEETSTLK